MAKKRAPLCGASVRPNILNMPKSACDSIKIGLESRSPSHQLANSVKH